MGQNHLFGIEQTEQESKQQSGLGLDDVVPKSFVGTTKTNAKKAGRGVSPRALMEKFKAKQYRCFFSGIELQREDASLDHVEPISRGGKHEEENLELVHAVINRMKGSMRAEEFVEWCVKVAVHSGGCTLPNRQNSQK